MIISQRIPSRGWRIW